MVPFGKSGARAIMEKTGTVKAEGTDRISAAVADLREAARRDLAAAWNERLRTAWEEEVDRVLRARLAGMVPRLKGAVQFEVGWNLAAEVEAAAPGIAARARNEAGDRFNRVLRRLLASEAAWPAVLLESAREFSGLSALFAVHEGMLAGVGDAIQVPLDRAPAFRNCIESRDTVVALRTPSELSPEIAALGAAARCHLVPVTAGERVIAVLYAEGGQADAAALETIAAVAGMVAARGAASEAAAATEGEEDHSDEELRAQKFARIRVAEMMLYRHDAVLSGRESRDLYSELRKEIDSAREAYATRFAAMEDYLHAELVRTLARGDAEALGASYPGPLP